MTNMGFPSIEEVSKSPAFPTAIWKLEPHQSGFLPVAAGRGGPLNISWEVHGDGPMKLIVSNPGYLPCIKHVFRYLYTKSVPL